MKPLTLNLARTIAHSAVNGPGERYVLWVQGCPLRCPGCWNPDTWSSRPRNLVGVEQIADEILGTPDIEGITFTGGEPFEQAEPLYHLGKLLRAAELSVMAFSGYEIAELTRPEQLDLLRICDVLVTGRYREELRTLELPWRGSSNQELHFLSPRYSTESVPDRAACEIHLGADGGMILTGFPPDELTASPRRLW